MKKTEHSLYESHKQLKARRILCVGWLDFAAFIAALPPRPSPKHRMWRHDTKRPFAPDNFFWQSPRVEGDAARYNKAWSSKNRRKIWGYRLKRLYGLSLDGYEALAAQQSSACAVCAARLRPYHELHVDHCHKSGNVRGLLCTRCNRGLQTFDDSPALLRKAADYIEKHNSS